MTKVAIREEEYDFTHNWFQWGEQVWPHLIKLLPDRRKMLELGAYEGRASTWIGENMLADDGILFCVDTWAGSEEHTDIDFDAVEKRFEHNQRVFNQTFPREIYKVKLPSQEFLARELNTKTIEQYDFIYVDASHTAKDVMTDACMAWPLLKEGGIMAFDDYLWKGVPNVLHQPKLAIDAFTTAFGEELEIIHVGYQMVVSKKGT